MSRLTRFSTLVWIVVIGWVCWGHSSSSVAADEATPAKVPVYEGLSSVGRKVTTSSPEAQVYFNQGLCFLYAFNHDQAIRSFRRATELDPDCAMAWWGLALANGPHINNPMVPPEREQAAWDALTKARRASQRVESSPVEKALIDAAGKRHTNPPAQDRKPLDEAYAGAMRDVFRAFPDDADVGALFAESMMDLRPWDLWTPAGEAQPGTPEVVATLEGVLAKAPRHPLALHLYIHAVEASPHPEKADVSADTLRDLQPGLGHLVHMASHIDVRRGRWKHAIEANVKAVASDHGYRAKSPRQGFYHIYMAHNQHMLAFAAMMCGKSAQAIAAINEMVRDIPADWVKENPAMADGFLAMPLEVLIRFGRWDEVLQAPEPPESLPLSRCLRHCARGIAYAAKKDVERAKEEQADFLKARAALPPEAAFGNNKGADVIAVAEHLLAGEILYREGKIDAGIAELRLAVEREDQLRYSEPPAWIHPVRHALGATLLTEGRAKEAEKLYREDLEKLPQNGWSLLGLSRSLRLQGKNEESAQFEAQFQKIWNEADVKISSSCFCQPGR